MMVKKIAVIALVAIIAVPILLGYAFNLTPTTITDYRSTGESVNVTPLMQTAVDYSYAHADTYQLNTKFGIQLNFEMLPVYETVSTQSSSLPLTKAIYHNQSWVGATQSLNYKYFYEQFDYDITGGANSHKAEIYYDDNGTERLLITTIDVHSIYYDQTTNYYDITRYSGTDSVFHAFGTAKLTKAVLTSLAGTCDVYVESYSSNRYANISDGYYFYGTVDKWAYQLPSYCRSVLLTMDLNTITDSSYSIKMMPLVNQAGYTLIKTEVAGQAYWSLQSISDPSDVIDLYYDNSRSSNTYQILWTFENTGYDGSMYHYSSHREFRYVGDWPTAIGEANVYLTFSDDVEYTYNYEIQGLNYFYFTDASNDRSPRIRMDDATFRAFEYPIINDEVYNPATFRENPATTISDPQIYGSSITFGGITYPVVDGNISISGHKVPVKDLVLSSVPNAGGTYDNKIGNTVISTSAAPSTISFNGKWSASISTIAQESYTYTKTEWHAGSFGWDGVDTNFLMVGLITCLGTFVALGIYARKSRSGGVIPLMIVTGCAAAVFFIML